MTEIHEYTLLDELLNFENIFFFEIQLIQKITMKLFGDFSTAYIIFVKSCKLITFYI